VQQKIKLRDSFNNVFLVNSVVLLIKRTQEFISEVF